MIVELGKQVVGTNGGLGTIAGFSIDPNSQSADQMVIKHGLPFRSARLAVLGHVVGVDTGIVRVDFGKEELETLEQYSPEAYRDDTPTGGLLPPSDVRGALPFEYGSGERTPTIPGADPTETPIHERHRMTPRYPTGEQPAPQDERLTVISQGMDVFDKYGEKLGHVQEFAVDTATGKPTRIELRHGLLDHERMDLVPEWVESYAPKGIVLNVSKEEVRGPAGRRDKEG